MNDIKVSLFASAVRPKLWPAFLKSLELGIGCEVIFCGNAEYNAEEFEKYNNFRYIKTSNIKPAQCYEIARRHCSGEVVVWVADDCEFPNNVIGKSYDYWKSQNNDKLILSIQTKESGYNLPIGQLFNMNIHRFFGGYNITPLMAPLGMMSRQYLEHLGGIDRRYVCGQYENDIVMRTYMSGGKVEIFGGEDYFIDIDHLGKSVLIGESKGQEDFRDRPFAKGYLKDREVLENSWDIKVNPTGGLNIYKKDKFEPFEDTELLNKSQSNKGQWE